MSRFEIVDDAPQGRFEIVNDPQPAKKEVGTLDRIKAGAAGINKGFYSDLLGLPVDTAANVIDLGKAAFGTAATALGRPDLAPEITSREGVPGSSDWFAKQINNIGLGGAINNPNPQDPASRIAYSGGRVGGASIVPVRNVPISLGQNALNVGKGVVSGLLGGSVAEVAPEWAGLASMAPQAATATGGAAIKRAVRGGEEGRQKMEQRIQDFKNAGIENPSVGLASGNNAIMGVENILSQTPGSAGLYQAAKDKMLSGIKGKTNEIRNDISPVYGAVEAGSAIQKDLKGAFKERIGDTYGLLNDKVGLAVGPDNIVPVTETLARSSQLTTPIKGAEATSSQLINPRIAKLAENLKTDVYGLTPPLKRNGNVGNPTLNAPLEPETPMPPANSSLWNAPAPVEPGVVSNSSLWNAPATTVTPIPQRNITTMPPTLGSPTPNAALWNAQKEKGIPFGALKTLRTDIGKEAASNAIMGTPEQAGFKQLYGAMSQDMKNGVAMADAKNGVPPTSPGSGTTALNRANTYYSRAMGRADDLNSLANRATPEGAYGAVANSLNSGPTVWQKLRGAVTPETRQKVVATIIDDMGVASPGQQGVAGDTWSPRAFLTNYNKMDQSARSELFKRLPGGAKHAENLSDIAKAAEMIDSGSKIWANPSGTAPALSARGTAAALTVGWYFEPMIAAGTAAGLLTGHAASRLLLSPKFTNWLANVPKVKPQDMQAYQQRLIANAKLSGDPQFQRDVGDYLSSVEQAKNNQ